MRIQAFVAVGVAALLSHAPAFGQDVGYVEFLTQAESVYPDAKAPRPFASGSLSSAYASEPEDRVWSAQMEARILAEIESAREQGLMVRRAEVECRTSTCSVLLVHAADREEGSVRKLLQVFRSSLGFGGVTKAEAEVPLQQTTPEGLTRTWFMSGYVDVLLTFGA